MFQQTVNQGDTYSIRISIIAQLIKKLNSANLLLVKQNNSLSAFNN